MLRCKSLDNLLRLLLSCSFDSVDTMFASSADLGFPEKGKNAKAMSWYFPRQETYKSPLKF